MKVLVLGASGHIGGRLLEVLQDTPWAQPAGSSRRPAHSSAGMNWVQLDSRDRAALQTALKEFDAVVNCVAGDGRSISQGMLSLTQAALAAECRRIVHLSTMSVYGPAEGSITEDKPLDPSLGWYGRAKCEAENHAREFVHRGGEAVVLRPGCVFGPGSELWVGRVGRWLRSGRLGDLGMAGDGWSNLVHVDDVCQAVLAALRLPLQADDMPAFNLSAPDSPRWNEYFIDLALALGATPVRRIPQRQLQLDAWLAGPPLKLLERGLKKLGRSSEGLPDALPPGLLGLWSQHIHLNAEKASDQLMVNWTPYAAALESSAAWFNSQGNWRIPPQKDAICTH